MIDINSWHHGPDPWCPTFGTVPESSLHPCQWLNSNLLNTGNQQEVATCDPLCTRVFTFTPGHVTWGSVVLHLVWNEECLELHAGRELIIDQWHSLVDRGVVPLVLHLCATVSVTPASFDCTGQGQNNLIISMSFGHGYTLEGTPFQHTVEIPSVRESKSLEGKEGKLPELQRQCTTANS